MAVERTVLLRFENPLPEEEMREILEEELDCIVIEVEEDEEV